MILNVILGRATYLSGSTQALPRLYPDAADVTKWGEAG